VSEFVILRHPTLPAEQTIRIDRRRIGAHLGAGWEEVKPEPAAEQPADGGTDQETTPAEPEKSKRRSRTSNEEQ
jgi:hypothetical protein